MSTEFARLRIQAGLTTDAAASQLGYSERQIFRMESGEIKLVEESGTRGLIEGLFSGRTDGVYYNVEAFIKQVQGAGYAKDSVVFRRELKTSHSLYMMSSIHHGDKIYALNQFLRDNRHWVRERKQYYGIE